MRSAGRAEWYRGKRRCYAFAMKRGALAMFDALGFKGIWQRPAIKANPDVVLRKLQALRRGAHGVVDRYLPPESATTQAELEREYPWDRSRSPDCPNGERVVSRMAIRFLSDTIVVGLTTMSEEEWCRNLQPSDDVLQSMTVAIACHVASELMHEAAISAPPLAYRGCVAYGDFEIDGPFIIGEAVDRAATAINLAQGAFVWMLPEAKDGRAHLRDRRHVLPSCIV
jgi:hypothetical protein